MELHIKVQILMRPLLCQIYILFTAATFRALLRIESECGLLIKFQLFMKHIVYVDDDDDDDDDGFYVPEK
jgi:hypothetical protein